MFNSKKIRSQYRKIHLLEVYHVSNKIRLQVQQNRFRTLQLLGQRVEEKTAILKQKYDVVYPNCIITKSRLKQGKSNTIVVTTSEEILDNTLSCNINNQNIPIENGRAVYNFEANRKGKYEIEVRFIIINPFTKRTSVYINHMKYEVS